MDFDSIVRAFCREAQRLGQREMITAFSRWTRTFAPDANPWFYSPEKDSRSRNRRVRARKGVLKGFHAEEAFRARTSEDFYVLFDYQNPSDPVIHHCAGLDPANVPRNHDVAIVDFERGWCMLFSHEDGVLTDGPYYREIGASSGGADASAAPDGGSPA